MNRAHRWLAPSLAFGTTLLLATSEAHADSIIKNPGDHPTYKVELEPQLALGWGHLYRGNGLGVGARFSIPIIDVGFVKSINDSIAISFGFDWLRYGDCYYYENQGNRRLGYGCGASYFVFPVAMQWNFWLTPNWSVFAEPGLYLYHGVYDNYCDPRFVNCNQPTRTSVDLAMFVGGRFHFNETVALTLRLGYPTSSFGVSLFF